MEMDAVAKTRRVKYQKKEMKRGSHPVMSYRSSGPSRFGSAISFHIRKCRMIVGGCRWVAGVYGDRKNGVAGGVRLERIEIG